MKKIFVFPGNQPCLDKITNDVSGKVLGVNRDRDPDAGWGELRRTVIENAVEKELTPELKQILLEDLAYAYGSNSQLFTAKLKEFGLFSIPDEVFVLMSDPDRTLRSQPSAFGIAVTSIEEVKKFLGDGKDYSKTFEKVKIVETYPEK